MAPWAMQRRRQRRAGGEERNRPVPKDTGPSGGVRYATTRLKSAGPYHTAAVSIVGVPAMPTMAHVVVAILWPNTPPQSAARPPVPAPEFFTISPP